MSVPTFRSERGALVIQMSGAQEKFAGVFFTLVGLILAGIAIALMVKNGFHGEYVPLTFFGALALLVGPLVGLSCRGMTIDKEKGKIEEWRGFMTPKPVATHPFDAFTEVLVCKRAVQSSSSSGGSKVVFPVIIEGENPLTVAHYSAAVRARAGAEAVARALGMPLRNSISGTDVVRPPDQLDWSLRQIGLNAEEPPTLPQLPAATSLKSHSKGGTYEVAVPPVGFLRGGILLGVLIGPPLIIPVGLVAVMFKNSPAALPIAVGLCCLPLAALAALSLWRGSRKVKITITKDELRLATSHLLGGSTSVIAMPDLEEVSAFVSNAPLRALIVFSGGVTFVTDAGLTTIGAGLDESDQQYICDLVRYVAIQD